MTGRVWMPLVGLVLGAAIAVLLIAWASSLTAPPEAHAQESQGEAPPRSDTHVQMHWMMDNMMGEGASERMLNAMPGSEEMMEHCAQQMEEYDGQQHMMGTMSMMDKTNHYADQRR